VADKTNDGSNYPTRAFRQANIHAEWASKHKGDERAKQKQQRADHEVPHLLAVPKTHQLREDAATFLVVFRGRYDWLLLQREGQGQYR